MHSEHPPRELKTKEVRQGLGAAVRGGEPASLRAGENQGVVFCMK